MIDFLSDTVSLPNEAMVRAMSKAEVGDDVYGEDPTVNRLQDVASEMLGKTAACFMPSGTMANLAAILAHCPRGYEAIVGDESDIYNYEASGPSVLGSVVLHPVRTEKDGTLHLDTLKRAIRDPCDYQFARARLICIENPHNLRGGRILPLDYLENLKSFALDKRLKLHMDGARIFNAAVALGITVDKIACHADSVQFCLSKSLCAPVGSILAGDKDFISSVFRLRKMLGGSMRQAGYIAAAGIVALQTMISRLEEDHLLALQLAKAFAQIEEINCDPETVDTNMVFFELKDSSITVAQFLEKLAKQGVRMSELGYGRIRAAVHRHIEEKDIDRTIQAVKTVLHKKQTVKLI